MVSLLSLSFSPPPATPPPAFYHTRFLPSLLFWLWLQVLRQPWCQLFLGIAQWKKKIKPRWIKLLNSCFTLVHMKVEQSESRKLWWCRVEKKWQSKMTFSDSPSRESKSCNLRAPWPVLSSRGIFASSLCLQVVACACIYRVCLHRLWCCVVCCF